MLEARFSKRRITLQGLVTELATPLQQEHESLKDCRRQSDQALRAKEHFEDTPGSKSAGLLVGAVQRY